IGRQLVFRLTPWSAQIHTKFHVHRITQEIPRRAPVFGYGPFTLYGAACQKRHLTFALPRRAPTTPSTFNRLRCLAFVRASLSLVNAQEVCESTESAGVSLFRFRSPVLRESLSRPVPPV